MLNHMHDQFGLCFLKVLLLPLRTHLQVHPVNVLEDEAKFSVSGMVSLCVHYSYACCKAMYHLSSLSTCRGLIPMIADCVRNCKSTELLKENLPNI